MNILKSNPVTQNLVNSIRIIYYNNSLEISMYNKILSFDDKEIALSNICIQGENLKIIYIDKYLIKVTGKINLIKGE